MLIDGRQLCDTLQASLALDDVSVEVARVTGHVHVTLPPLTPQLRRRAQAICHLYLPAGAVWTIREETGDDC